MLLIQQNVNVPKACLHILIQVYGYPMHMNKFDSQYKILPSTMNTCEHLQPQH